MAEQALIWQWLLDALDKHQSAALLIVTESRGSTPGKTGAKMAVTDNGSIGTIGGGLFEADLIETARSMLLSGTTRPQLCKRSHHLSSTLESSGMICGGEQTALIYPCGSNDKAIFECLAASCRNRAPLNLVVSAQGLQIFPTTDLVVGEFVDGDNWLYRETIGQCKRAYIVGAGHVGLALSKVLSMLGFDITLLDAREPVPLTLACPPVRLQCGIDYDDIGRHIPEGPDVFVFVMTHEHQGDLLVLTQLAGKKVAYLGVLGSRHKADRIRNCLRQTWSDEQLQSLHVPMGLSINSHAPEEIAISIAAEVVQIANPRQKDKFLPYRKQPCAAHEPLDFLAGEMPC